MKRIDKKLFRILFGALFLVGIHQTGLSQVLPTLHMIIVYSAGRTGYWFQGGPSYYVRTGRGNWGKIRGLYEC